MFYSDNEYYDAALAEVREHQIPGTITEAQTQMLKDDPLRWEEALQKAIDELDAQLEIRREELADSLNYGNQGDAQALRDDFERWRSKNRTFKKYVVKRLRVVQRLNNTGTESVENGLPISPEEGDEIVRAILAAVQAEDRGENDEVDSFIDKAMSVAAEALFADA